MSTYDIDIYVRSGLAPRERSDKNVDYTDSFKAYLSSQNVIVGPSTRITELKTKLNQFFSSEGQMIHNFNFNRGGIGNIFYRDGSILSSACSENSALNCAATIIETPDAAGRSNYFNIEVTLEERGGGKRKRRRTFKKRKVVRKRTNKKRKSYRKK
jgi:hypothetical protein